MTDNVERAAVLAALHEIQPTVDQIEFDSDMFQVGRACGIEDAKDAISALPPSPDSGGVERLREYAKDIIDAVDDGNAMDVVRARDQLADELAALAGPKS